MSERTVQMASWINVVPHNRRERLARWWKEDICQGSTYISERQRQQEFQTNVPADEISKLASDGLRSALTRQLEARAEKSEWVEFLRATPDGFEYFDSISIPSGPLNAQFSPGGIVEL